MCVDDAHLLDETSLEALGFVAARLEAEGVALLVATGGDSVPGEPAFEVIELGPLDRGAAFALLERRFGDGLSPHVAAEVIAVASGNPLALVEIPLSLSADQRAGRESIGEALQTRRSAEQALLQRIASLTDRERRTLLVPALARSGDLAVVERALKILDLDAAGLEKAKQAGFVSLEDGRIGFTHGLVRSTVSYGARRKERRQTHAALAQVLDPDTEPEAVAWHRALAASATDERVAAAIEEAGAAAARRWAHADAARAYEHAARLSPDGQRGARRLVHAAEQAGVAGHVYAAVDNLESALTELEDPDERSEAERLLGRLLSRTGSAARARDVLLSSASSGSVDPAGIARALTDAVIPTLRAGDPAQACEIGRRALRLAEGTDPSTEIAAAVALSTALILSGAFAEGRQLALRAAELADASQDLDGDLQLRSYLGGALRLAGEYDRARDVLVSVVAEARSSGAAGVLAYALVRLGDVELDQGRWTLARRTLADAAALAIETGQSADRGLAAGGLAWLAAVEGREQESRDRASEALRLADRLGVGSRLARASHAHGLLELGLGRFDVAADALADALRQKEEQGWSDAAVPPHWAPDLVEALVLAGRVDDARRELASFETEALRVGRDSSLAALSRCRGLLSTDAAAAAAFEEALAVDIEATGPFERARTELAYAERLIEGDRVDAKRLFAAALQRFTELGAQPWSARARDGLQRLGVEEPAALPRPLARLNERELTVVFAIAEGQSTRDAATGLMLTVPTVDHNLRTALVKLGLDSPGDLRALLAEEMPAATR